VTQPTLYVGIDVANATVSASFLTGEARPMHPQVTYPNDPEGWTALRTAIVAAAARVSPQARVVCGMEATGNMHQRLEQALRAERWQVHVLNPRAVKRFVQALLGDAKTDRGDSHRIALFLLRMQPEARPELPRAFEEFREATRTRRRLVEDRTDCKNRLHKLLRYHFPGYRRRLGKGLSKGVVAVLAAMPSPDALLARSPEELAAFSYGARGYRLGAARAQQFHTLAAQAPQARLPEVSRLLIATTARRILELDALIAQLDPAIERMLHELFPHQVLTTIPGLAKVSAAAILAEVADIHRFQDQTRFVGYCGLYPIVWESGEAKRRYRMTRKGNRMLKMTLLLASASARQYNPLIAAFYERLRRRGKSKKAAGGAIARKLAALVYAVLVTGEPWSAEKAAQGMERARAMVEQGAEAQTAGAPCLTGEALSGQRGPQAKSRSRNSRTPMVPEWPYRGNAEPHTGAYSRQTTVGGHTMQPTEG